MIFQEKNEKNQKNIKNLGFGVGTVLGPHLTSQSSKISKCHEIYRFWGHRSYNKGQNGVVCGLNWSGEHTNLKQIIFNKKIL